MNREDITLPREVVQEALEALEFAERNNGGDDCYADSITALRTHLAAEQQKQKPVAWMDRFGSVVLGKGPYETFTTPLYTFPPDAPTVKESLTHPGYVIGSHWLETAYSRICAGEAEADVLRDCGWERVDDAEALRRDAERYRKQKERSYRLQRLLKECVKVMQANAVFRDTKAHKDLKTRIRAELEDKR